MGASNPTYHTVIGNTEVVQYRPRRVWDATNGWSTVTRYEGTAEAIQAKANELANNDSGVDVIEEDIHGKAGTLMCRVYEDAGSGGGGNTEELNAVWELIAQDILKPIERHSDYNAIKEARKRDIENYVRDRVQYSSITAPTTDAEKALAGYFANQTLDFYLTQLILRKTCVVTTKSAITISYTGMNRVVTLASINPPSILLGTLTSLPLESGSSGAWEWLKKGPQLRQIARRKFQIVYEYWGAEKWAEIYGGSWTPVWSE